jgi:uncharacterized protein YgbK (DUF1537 family)
MYKLLVLADDLTGAMDTGVQFVKNGIAAKVILSPLLPGEESGFREDPEAAVLIINTGSRHRPPEEAWRIIRRCTEAWRDRGIEYFYKKTDSTLRGNVGMELEALMDALNIRQLPFIPAYPDLGRTTLQGRQYLEGIPIDETAIAQDPLNPIRNSLVAKIITRESTLPVRILAGPAEIPEVSETEREILVFDCENNEQLREIGEELKKHNLLRASAGCAGFAEVLVHALPFEALPPLESGRLLRPALPVLVLAGSRHPLSRGQVKYAMERGVPGLEVDGEKLNRQGWLDSSEARNLAGQCAAILSGQGICILGTRRAMEPPPVAGGTAPFSNDAGEGSIQAPREEWGSAESVSEGLGALARKILPLSEPLCLMVSGGDTLLGVVKALEYDSIIPLTEIRPGVVLARGNGPEGGGFMVTKAGAFGEEDLILLIQDYLKRKPSIDNLSSPT